MVFLFGYPDLSAIRKLMKTNFDDIDDKLIL